MQYRNWPGRKWGFLETLTNSWLLSGIGVTTVALDFSESQDVELGLAPTLSMLDNRILAGYGWNLQAEDNRGFWFFSIRLFSRSGGMNPTLSASARE
jgi:hypothetical protein